MDTFGHLNRSHARQILLGIALFALLFRVAFPAGYMPYPSGQDTDTLTVVLCTPHGDTNLAQAPDDGATGHPCPFCAVVSQAFMPGATTLAATPAPAHDLLLIVRDHAAPTPTLLAGPPMGPRAPPPYLG